MVMYRQLGFNPAGAIAVSSTHFGQGVGPIWLISFGSEPNLDSCHHNAWRSHNCGHSIYAVIYRGKTIY